MAQWLGKQPLVLASQSAIRRTVLEASGIALETRPADIDERGIEAAAGPIDPAAAALLLAREKALAVSRNMPGRWVLGADQTLALGPRRFSKAKDRAGARAHLQALRGQTHALHSAIAVARDGAVRFDHVEDARLSMREFNDEFLERYLDRVGAAALQSVGSYQLESIGIQLFRKIEGSHFTILGLPLLPLLDWLRGEKLMDG